MQKLPATCVRQNGCKKDDVNIRRKWAIRKVGDRYIELPLLYQDAKVAEILVVKGLI